MRAITTNTTHGRDVQGVGGMYASRSECSWPCEGFCRDCCASSQWLCGGNQLENACGYHLPMYLQNRTQRLHFVRRHSHLYLSVSLSPSRTAFSTCIELGMHMEHLRQLRGKTIHPLFLRFLRINRHYSLQPRLRDPGPERYLLVSTPCLFPLLHRPHLQRFILDGRRMNRETLKGDSLGFISST